MIQIDSRRLTKYAGFLKRFDKPDVYKCRINYLSQGLEDFQVGPEFVITVKSIEGKTPTKRSKDGEQHTIHVTYDAYLRNFRPDPEHLKIKAGDKILWHKPCKEGGPFSVSGKSKRGDTFDSRQLGYGEVFMYTFLHPGKYSFANISGDVDEKSGTIEVSPAGKNRKAWMKRLEKPVCISCEEGKFSEHEAEIVLGNTVMWAVLDDTGVIVVIKQQSRPRKIIRKVIGGFKPPQIIQS